MKTVAIGLLFTLAACGRIDRNIAIFTGSSELCVDGVRYLQFSSGASVKYTRDGKIATC